MGTKLQMILTQEELNRIKLQMTDNPQMTVDLHNLSVKQAKRLLGNIIALSDKGTDIKVIHGYNHGTAIRTMILNDLNSLKIAAKEVSKRNPGLTDIKLAV